MPSHPSGESPSTTGTNLMLNDFDPGGMRSGVRDAGVLFLNTEVRVGLTFAWIALRSRQTGWEHKAERNRLAARRAYDALLRFRHRVMLTVAQSATIESGVDSLREQLMILGEAV